MYAFDAKTGVLKWKYWSKGIIHSSPAIYENVLYFTCKRGFLYAVDAVSGKELWNLNNDSRPSVSSPAIADGVAYYGTNSGNIYAVDIKTAEKLWSFKSGQGLQSAPVVLDGVVYFSSMDGHIYALQ
jgi:outer membrane protein assembly factor BamB